MSRNNNNLFKTQTNFFQNTFNQRQKQFTTPQPVRDYKRLSSAKIANSGRDPNGAFIEFISKDIITPLKRNNLYLKFEEDFKTQRPLTSNKWALNTIKRAPNYETLPKFQQFKTYYFPPQFNNKSPEQYRNFSLKTDHISINIPKIKKISSDKSFLKMKSEYSVQKETKKGWVPLSGFDTINNQSGVNYNIITFQPLLYRTTNEKGKIMNQMKKDLNNKKKGVAEYADLTRTYRENYNPDYQRLFKENNKRFFKYQGIFSDMYDSARKNGDLYKPFANNNNNVFKIEESKK
jgi:hypothetical protein